MKQPGILLVSVIMLSMLALAASKSETKGRTAGPDKAYMQKIWDGWSTLDTANVTDFYASGPRVFFDIAPLKYSSWDEYRNHVGKELADYKSAKFTVNDDAELHPAGNYVWGTATIKEDALLRDGKHEMATLRWTVIWEKRDGKWLIVHDHTSEPLQ